MFTSSLSKIGVALKYLCTRPLLSLSWVRRGGLLTDRTVVAQTYWFGGRLTRTPLVDMVPNAREAAITVPRAYDRTFRTSITITEACTLATLVRARGARRVLEIGTFDGNTALLFGHNLPEDGKVVTVDLPPDFDPKKDQSSLGHAEVKINLTPRELVARQYRNDPAASKIQQVYGDSATLNWRSFGAPFDLIFIDGCHKEAYVTSDTENAFSVLAPRGVIVWHDYGEIPDVSRVVDRAVSAHPEYAWHVVEGTRLAIAMKP